MGSATVAAGSTDGGGTGRTVGRHRRDAGVAVPAPPGRAVTRHARAEVGPDEPEAPAPADPVGLRMFNLGTIPASVTPPRSWRRAAWFTIVASAAALLGLLAVGAVLVGPARSTTRTVALPVFPSGVPLAGIGGVPLSAVGRPALTRARVTGAGTPSRPVVRPRSAPDVVARPTGAPVVAVAPTLPAVVVTTVGGGEPVIDPTKLIRQTQTFFAEVTSNAQAAANLTDQTVRDDATALIRRKYGDVSAIRIQRISLDASNGLTVSVLRVVNKDGSTTTQQTTLQFTLTNDPLITNPGG